MLILSRKVGQAIVIADNIVVMVTKVHGDQVRLGITAPPDVPVDRSEIHVKKERSREGDGHDS